MLTATPELGELVTPAAVTFHPASWQAPREILLDAVDDAVIEPLHYDTFAYALSSADPRYDVSLADRTAIAILDNDGNADIEIVVQNAPSAVTAGSVFEVVYRITNNGPTRFTGGFIMLAPSAGAGTLVLEQVYGVVSCAQDQNGADYCDFAGGNPGESRVIPVVYRATGAGALTLGATLYSYQPDPNGANNSVQVQITVN